MSDQTETTSTPEPTTEAAPAVAPASPETQPGLAVLLEREAATEAARVQLREREAQVSRWEKMEVMSPAEQAAALGLSLPDLQKQMVDSYDPNQEVTAKLSALEQRIKAQDDARDAARLEAAREAELSKVRTFIDGSDEFLITKTGGFHDTVIEAVQIAAKSGKTLSEAQAASNVEAGLFDLVQKAMAIPQIREKILGKVAEAAEPVAATKSNPLTNRSASSSSKPRAEGGLLRGDAAVEQFASMLGFTE